jgi:hypothetical protein
MPVTMGEAPKPPAQPGASPGRLPQVVEAPRPLPTYVELNFTPTEDLIDVVRKFVETFYDRVGRDPESTAKLVVATHELLENAIKYSIDGKTHLRIELDQETRVVAVRTSNRARGAHIETLQQAIDEIAAAPDPEAHYQMLLARAALRTEGSGLGLGRIRAEADMSMHLDVQGDVVILHARTCSRPS